MSGIEKGRPCNLGCELNVDCRFVAIVAPEHGEIYCTRGTPEKFTTEASVCSKHVYWKGWIN